MLTQNNIEDKKFTYWRTSEQSVTNNRPNRDDYLAIGTKHKGNTNEINKVLLLSYDLDGYITISDYFNNPIRFKEYYINYIQVNTIDELNDVLEKSGFEISVINLNELTTHYE